MDSALLAVTLPSLLVVPLMGILSRLPGGSGLRCEIRRKAVHVIAGLASLGLPFVLQESAQVMLALAIMAAWMVAARRVPVLCARFGRVFSDVTRVSAGELYFAAAVAALLLLSPGGGTAFVLPVLLLTVADTAAALVGRYLPWRPLGAIAGDKTLSGSLAFACTGCLVSAIVLLASGGAWAANVLPLSLALGLGCAAVEALSHRGFDNFSVPAVAWLVLYLA